MDLLQHDYFHYENCHQGLEEDDDDDEDIVIFKHRDEWKRFFESIDMEGFGEVAIFTVQRSLQEASFLPEMTEYTLGQLQRRLSDMQQCGKRHISFQEFIGILTRKRRLSFKCAVHARDRQVATPDDFHWRQKRKMENRTKGKSLETRLKAAIARQIIASDLEINYFCTSDRGFRLPIVAIISSVILICLYFEREVIEDHLVFISCRTSGVWRYFSYVLIHRDLAQLTCNVLCLIVVAFPLEIVYGSARILLIFLLGVLAGSIYSSALECHVPLVGSSAGTLSLVIALISYWISHYDSLEGCFKWAKVLTLITFSSFEIGISICNRYITEAPQSFYGHIGGIMSGLIMGSVILAHFDRSLLFERKFYCRLFMYGLIFIILLIYSLLKNEDRRRYVINIIQSAK